LEYFVKVNSGFFFGHSLKNSRWKKLKLKLKKLKTQELFAQNSKFRQFFFLEIKDFQAK